jgi:hypothetical protein
MKTFLESVVVKKLISLIICLSSLLLNAQGEAVRLEKVAILSTNWISYTNVVFSIGGKCGDTTFYYGQDIGTVKSNYIQAFIINDRYMIEINEHKISHDVEIFNLYRAWKEKPIRGTKCREYTDMAILTNNISAEYLLKLKKVEDKIFIR